MLYISENHCSSRKQRSLNLIHIKADLLLKECRCPFQCKAFFDSPKTPEIVLQWRRMYHNVARGTKQQLQLMNLLRCSRAKSKGTAMICHYIDGFFVCRCVTRRYMFYFVEFKKASWLFADQSFNIL
jgi:hypothetical protein